MELPRRKTAEVNSPIFRFLPVNVDFASPHAVQDLSSIAKSTISPCAEIELI
jgi:hypothetical protein